MVVNSARRSGLFSSAGWSVFFSQACSLAEGARSTEDVSAGDAACVVPLDRSLILVAPRGEFNYLFERPQRLMLFERYLRGKGSLAAPQTREHQFTIQTRKYGNEKAGPGLAPGPALPARLPISLGGVFLGGQFFVAYRLSVFDGSIWCFAVVGPPEVKDNAVCLSCSLRDLLGLLRRPVEDLNAPGGNLDRVVMIKLVPVLKGNIRPRDIFGNEVFDLLEQGIGFGGFVNQAFEHIVRNSLAVMMVGSHHFAIQLVRSQDMNIMAVGGCARVFLWRSAPRSQDKDSGNQKQ